MKRWAPAIALVLACGCRVNVELGLLPEMDATVADGGETEDASSLLDADALTDAGRVDAAKTDAALNDVGSSSDALPGAIGIVTSGAYTLDFMPGPGTMCFDALAGHESDFASLTPASVHFESGPVTVTTSTTGIVVEGQPLIAGFGESTMMLTMSSGAGGQPPPSWYVIQVNAAGPGPGGTLEAARLLAIDTAIDGSAPSGFLGQSGVAYTNTSSNGTCVVEFIARFTTR